MSPVNLMTSTSTWIQVTGWTLAHFVWQGALIAIMVAATLRLGRRWPSEARYVVACGRLVAMVIVPIATALVLSSRSPGPLTTAAPTTMPAPGLTTGPSLMRPMRPYSPQCQPSSRPRQPVHPRARSPLTRRTAGCRAIVCLAGSRWWCGAGVRASCFSWAGWPYGCAGSVACGVRPSPRSRRRCAPPVTSSRCGWACG